MTETRFGLCTFADPTGASQPGLVIDDLVWGIADLVDLTPGAVQTLSGCSILQLLDTWSESLAALQQLANGAGASGIAGTPLAQLDLRAPVEWPRQVFCTGANYRKHVVDLTVDMGVGPEGLDEAGLREWATAMMEQRAREGEPYVFTKPVSAIAGPNDPLVVPPTTKKLDWELELAVVIGRQGYNIALADAMDHVAGYAIVNDISARDLIARTDYKMLGTDWLRAKGQPGFLPFGPVLMPARFVPEPERLAMRLSVGDKVMQDESTADMLFGIARQIEYISRYARLLPGDLICTGSPAGNGTHYNRYLEPGDIMIAEIEGLGRQTVHCTAPGELERANP
jgi:2,4-didehydro-3-deoxy-L-rhamnonate hydrolase